MSNLLLFALCENILGVIAVADPEASDRHGERTMKSEPPHLVAIFSVTIFYRT